MVYKVQWSSDKTEAENLLIGDFIFLENVPWIFKNLKIEILFYGIKIFISTFKVRIVKILKCAAQCNLTNLKFRLKTKHLNKRYMQDENILFYL